MSHYGLFGDEKLLTTSFTTLIDGLTTAGYVSLSAPSTNLGDALLQHKSQSGTGAGFRLRPGDRLENVFIGGDNSAIVAKASTSPGVSLSYLGHGQA